MKLTFYKQHEMYMPNAKMLRWGPNTTYIPLTGVGGNTNFRFGVGGDSNLKLRVGSKIPTCWYLQRKILASGALPNANP